MLGNLEVRRWRRQGKLCPSVQVLLLRHWCHLVANLNLNASGFLFQGKGSKPFFILKKTRRNKFTIASLRRQCFLPRLLYLEEPALVSVGTHHPPERVETHFVRIAFCTFSYVLQYLPCLEKSAHLYVFNLRLWSAVLYGVKPSIFLLRHSTTTWPIFTFFPRLTVRFDEMFSYSSSVLHESVKGLWVPHSGDIVHWEKWKEEIDKTSKRELLAT